MVDDMDIQEIVYTKNIFIKKIRIGMKLPGKRIRNAIASVRGTVYESQPSVGLYPTSGKCHDYLYCLRYIGIIET